MAFDRRSSRIAWKRRPILPTIAGTHFPVSPSLRAEPVRRRCGGLRRGRSTIEHRWLTIDGSAGTSIYRFDGNLASLEFLRYDVSNLAYAIPNLKIGAVIGVGGGRDVLSQRLLGISDVTGIEINPIIIDVS